MLILEVALGIVLAAIILALPQFRPKHDWYVVEWRICTDANLCSTALTADNVYLDSGAFRVTNRPINAVFLDHKDGGSLRIYQTVFSEIDAATLYFARTKEMLPGNENFHKLALWRIVSRSRKAALVLPPDRYDRKDGRLLEVFPRHFWVPHDMAASK